MGTTSILVRDLEPETKRALQAQAARNRRSMSAEARTILSDALQVRDDEPQSAAAHASRYFPPELRVDGDLAEFNEDPAPPPEF